MIPLPFRILLAAWVAAPVAAQCPAFRAGFADTGPDNTVRALAVHDDGAGPALFLGGQFVHVTGNVLYRHVAKWDGVRWESLSTGQPGGTVRALASGTGLVADTLFVGGEFYDAQPATPDFLAAWDGAAWSAIAGGQPDSSVTALLLHDDGSGLALYAGGHFGQVGALPAAAIARWTPGGWSALGSGIGGSIEALAVHDDGGGAALFAGGTFASAGGTAASHVAKWDGANWSALGTGTDGTVRALASYQGALYAGGDFTAAGSGPAAHLARWDGAGWSPLGSGADGPVHALSVHDDGSGTKLFASGPFASAGGLSSPAVARWDGSAWSATDAGLSGATFALQAFDDGSGTKLFAGGNCALHSSAEALNLVRWSGVRWTAISKGLSGAALAVEVWDDGTGEALYAGGNFRNAGGFGVDHIARWKDGSWHSLGGVGNSLTNRVHDLRVHDDGSGEALFVGGRFTLAGGVPANNVARWDGASWSALGSGTQGLAGDVFALCSGDIGAGPRLYVAGWFDTVGGLPSRGVGAWDGSSWHPMPGLGLGSTGQVTALAVYDAGSGPELYACGDFTVLSDITSDVARWNGATWVGVGGGTTGTASLDVLYPYSDATGSWLLLGGAFTQIGGQPISWFARFDGASWSTMGTPQAWPVEAIGMFDDGTGAGSRLYLGSGTSNPYTGTLRRWDGSNWTTVAATQYQSFLYDFASFRPSPTAPAELWIAGSFLTQFDGIGAAGVVPYVACNETGRRLCFGDGSGTACPCGNTSAPAEAAGCANSTGTGGALRGSGEARVTADSLVLTATGVPPTTSMLFFQGTTTVVGGLGSAFGDGLRCAGGSVIRMGTNFANSGVCTFGYGVAGDPLIHIAGAVSQAGTVRYYQGWYRNAAAFCTPSTFNLTNGVAMTWTP